MTRLSLRTAATIAWREARASSAKFIFVILAVAAGVGALSGVRGFSESLRKMLRREARTLLAADLMARSMGDPVGPRTVETLDKLSARGVDITKIVETVSLASAGSGPPMLVSIKAVDPAKYPYYGQIGLQPETTLAQALNKETVVVSEDLLLRLNIKTGGSFRLGGLPYRVAAIVTSEPDRLTGTINVGFCVMMSRDGLERAGLIRPGSRFAERFLFK